MIETYKFVFSNFWITLFLSLFLIFVLLQILFKMYMIRINTIWDSKQEWMFLRVTVPRDNEKSPIAFEHIFNQLHAIHASPTFAEEYIEGEFQLWLSWETVSIGGKIYNYIKLPVKHRDIFEAAVYSQFPDAEIVEAEDYLKNLPKYDPDESEYDIFAYRNKYLKDSYYPMRTYYDFEHSSADTFVDPIAGMWEELGKINQYEMVIIQYILRPIGDDDWKQAGYKLVKKLKGEPSKGGSDVIGVIQDILGNAIGGFLDIIIRPTVAENAKVKFERDEPPSMMLHLSEGEKEVISSVEKKLSKWGYETKINVLYVSPKEKYNYGPSRTAIVGAFKAFGANHLNSLKPKVSGWTKANYFIFKELERPLTEFRTKWRKRHYMKFIRERDYYGGPAPDILSTEEVASILHFPQMDVTVPDIEKVAVTKVQPPPELPIAE